MGKKKNKNQDSDGQANNPHDSKKKIQSAPNLLQTSQTPSTSTSKPQSAPQTTVSGQQQSQQGGRGQQPQQAGRGQQPQQAGRGQQPQQAGRGQQPQQAGRGQQPQQAGRGQQPQQVVPNVVPPSAWGQPAAQSVPQPKAWGPPATQPQSQQGGRGPKQPQQAGHGQQTQQGGQPAPQTSAWGTPASQQQPLQGDRGQQQPQQAGRGQQPQQAGRGQQPQQAGRGQQPQQAGRGQQPQQAGRGQQPQQAGRGQQSQQASRGSSQSSSTREQTPKDLSKDTYVPKIEYVRTKDSYDVARRMEKGTLGEKIRIEVNYLKLGIENISKSIFHYDITFDPDKPKKSLPYIFEKFRLKHFPKIYLAFDGKKNVYSSKRLPISQVLESEVVYRDEITTQDRTYKVAMKEVVNSEIDMTVLLRANGTKPLRQINVLDIVLRMAFQCKAVAVGRSFFRPPNRKVDLGDGYELWTGLFQSAVLGSRPYLNVDVAHKGFPSSTTVIELLKSFRYPPDPNREMDSRTKDDVYSKLKGLNLIYQIDGVPPKLYKFNALKDSAQRQTFLLEDGRKLTVEQYFRTKNITLKYPLMPCIHAGNSMKNIYLPMEFCTIQQGQALMKKLNENQTRNMIRETATSTDIRKQKIMDILKTISHNNNPVIKEFGINVGAQFEEIGARILKAPTLEYKDRQKVFSRDGVWRAEGKHFLNGKTMTVWHILILDDRCPNNIIHRFAGMIKDHGRSLNMTVSDQYDTSQMRPIFKDFEIDNLLRKLKDSKVELLFVVIPDRPDCYARVKQAAELRCGILTQCVKSSTLQRRLDASTVSNILLKVNSKLNGTNHKVAQDCCPNIIKDSVMLIGADVTHPAGDQNEPSVVGVAASHDETSFRYNICWRLQDPKKEIIVDLKNIVIDQLRFYQKELGKLPNRILYYRDGVSDGQFQEVLDVELKAVYAACQQVKPNYKPLVTFIIVQKRHHTRFFPGNSGKKIGKNNNVCPGTIVDNDITAPNELQFFLVSHASIQGVAKPTKYCLLWDDSKIPVDELQALTYNLCHLFTRCNRAVSYVAPTYYAHLAAYRGRVYVTGERINLDKLDQEFKNRQIKREIVHDHPMFFV